MQAVISIFADEGNKIKYAGYTICCSALLLNWRANPRYINAGSSRIAFLLKSPLYYAVVSDWGEPESVVSSISLTAFHATADAAFSCVASSNTCICKFFPSSRPVNYNEFSPNGVILTLEGFSKVCRVTNCAILASVADSHIRHGRILSRSFGASADRLFIYYGCDGGLSHAVCDTGRGGRHSFSCIEAQGPTYSAS
jgi:hypothetical protein